MSWGAADKSSATLTGHQAGGTAHRPNKRARYDFENGTVSDAENQKPLHSEAVRRHSGYARHTDQDVDRDRLATLQAEWEKHASETPSYNTQRALSQNGSTVHLDSQPERVSGSAIPCAALSTKPNATTGYDAIRDVHKLPTCCETHALPVIPSSSSGQSTNMTFSYAHNHLSNHEGLLSDAQQRPSALYYPGSSSKYSQTNADMYSSEWYPSSSSCAYTIGDNTGVGLDVKQVLSGTSHVAHYTDSIECENQNHYCYSWTPQKSSSMDVYGASSSTDSGYFYQPSPMHAGELHTPSPQSSLYTPTDDLMTYPRVAHTSGITPLYSFLDPATNGRPCSPLDMEALCKVQDWHAFVTDEKPAGWNTSPCVSYSEPHLAVSPPPSSHQLTMDHPYLPSDVSAEQVSTSTSTLATSVSVTPTSSSSTLAPSSRPISSLVPPFTIPIMSEVPLYHPRPVPGAPPSWTHSSGSELDQFISPLTQKPASFSLPSYAENMISSCSYASGDETMDCGDDDDEQSEYLEDEDMQEGIEVGPSVGLGSETQTFSSSSLLCQPISDALLYELEQADRGATNASHSNSWV